MPKSNRNEAALLKFCIDLLDRLEMLGQLTYLRNQTHGRVTGRGRGKNANKGSPDILIWFRGGLAIGLELKDPLGSLSHAQITFKSRWQRIGVPYHVERTPEGVVKLLHKYGASAELDND